MSEKLNPSPKIPNGEYPELSPNPNYTDGYIKGEHATPVRVVTAPQRGIRQETEPTNFAELYVSGKKPLLEGEVSGGAKLYKHYIKTSNSGGFIVIISTVATQQTDTKYYYNLCWEGKGYIAAINSFPSNIGIVKLEGAAPSYTGFKYVLSFDGTNLAIGSYPFYFVTDTVTEL